MLKRVLLSLVALVSLACPKPKTETTPPPTPDPKPKKAAKPIIPAAPSAPGRRTDFTAMRTSKTPQGFDSDALLDNNLGTSWISRPQAEDPLLIEFALPEEGGVCIKKIGFVSGVFGDPILAKQVTRPTKLKIVHSISAGKPAKGKKSKELPKSEASFDFPDTPEGSSDIQWLEFPEVCKVTRTTITLEVPSGELQDVAIAELYVEAQ
jgi:hypothetical protein